MSEENTKSISARGAFTIGLVLGAGLLLVFSIIQTSRMKNEINKLKEQLILTDKKVIQARADMIEMLKAQNKLPTDQTAVTAPISK
ncbi:MAG: hypothetical protein V1899_01010 [Planctomycetota bacterium]